MRWHTPVTAAHCGEGEGKPGGELLSANTANAGPARLHGILSQKNSEFEKSAYEKFEIRTISQAWWHMALTQPPTPTPGGGGRGRRTFARLRLDIHSKTPTSLYPLPPHTEMHIVWHLLPQAWF